MVNTILSSISKALYTKFGDTYHYYVEDVEQGTKTPCFHIEVLNPMFRSTNHKDYYWTMPVVLHFFTNDKVNTNKTCFDIGQQTLECLEYLKTDKLLLRGRDMNFTMVDDVLQVFITYNFWTENPEDIPVMEEVDGIEFRPN